jgi:hypothetical protein
MLAALDDEVGVVLSDGDKCWGKGKWGTNTKLTI